MNAPALMPATPELPHDLTALNQWVLWRYETRNGKPTKVPYQVNGKRAKCDDPHTWSRFETVTAVLREASATYSGVGFVFADSDSFVGIDLDDCIDRGGSIEPWATQIIERFSNTYMEVSPSGRGVKIFARGGLPGPGRRAPYGDGSIEIYDRGRFFTTTGNALNGAPLQVADHESDVAMVYALASNRGCLRRKPKADLNRQTPVVQGQRYDFLQSAAAQYRARGMSRDEIHAALAEINQKLCDPPKFDPVLQELADWAATLEPRNRGMVQMPASTMKGAGGRNWHEYLIANLAGTPKPILANAITALRQAPDWDGVLGFNEFSLGTVALNSAPHGSRAGGEWTDHDDRLTANWLQCEGIYVSVEIAGQAVQTVARDRLFHPVRAYLDSLEWDRTKRIESWLSVYLGAKPDDYSAAVGARWLISAVARIYRPGAKVDCCLILEGPQGLKKSTALRTLAGEWFTDEIADLGSKDAAMQTRGVWVIELAELDSMTRSEVSRVKAFMSRATDRFRPPYGKRLVESPRQCVFAGSVNHSAYLRDETGGRRFWPVACARISVDDLGRDRDQLWAEAVVRFRAGSIWWLDTLKLNQLAEHEQFDRYEGDPWDELIGAWLEQPCQRTDGTGHAIVPFSSTPDTVTVVDVLNHCIGKRQDQWSQSDKNRVARSLRSQGWERYKARTGERREWRYRRAPQ
jgi:predicted P-loop ATPase